MAEATLSPTKDTQILDWSPYNNYGGSTTMACINDSTPRVASALISFDLSGLDAASIESATLGVYVHNRTISGTVNVYKLTRNDWVESEANWNRYKSLSNWSTAGGDYVTSSPSGASGTPPAANNWWTRDVTAIVSDALTNSVQANFILVGAYQTNYSFRTKEDSTESTRPYLNVTYTPAVQFAEITTSPVTNLTPYTAQANGNITYAGLPDPDERGFVYGTTSKSAPGNVAPTSSGYDDYENETGTYSTGAYNLTLSSLDSGTTYYVRAYAHNSAGYAYGDEVSFLTGLAASFDPAVLELYPLSFTDEVKWAQGFSPAVLVTRGQRFSSEILDTVTVLTDTAIVENNQATLRGIFSGLGVTKRGFYLWDETWDYPPEES